MMVQQMNFPHDIFFADMDAADYNTIDLTQPTISSYFHDASHNMADTQGSTTDEATAAVLPDIDSVIDSGK